MKLMENRFKKLEDKAPPGAFSVYDIAVLVPEVEKLKAGAVYLEIGVDQGRSLWIAKQVAKSGVEIIGIDIKPTPKIKGTDFYQGNSLDFARLWTKMVDLLFIDGDHSYQGCKADIEAWYPFMKPGATMLFHDYDISSPGVIKAVKQFEKSALAIKSTRYMSQELRTSIYGIKL